MCPYVLFAVGGEGQVVGQVAGPLVREMTFFKSVGIVAAAINIVFSSINIVYHVLVRKYVYWKRGGSLFKLSYGVIVKLINMSK